MGNQLSDRAQSLEDILHNLKKYRTKFAQRRANHHQQRSLNNNSNNTNAYVNKEGSKSATLPRLACKCGGISNENLNRVFESSTWRVMRHLKSADIRNKYPLPKANPDYHFRNATIFQTAGRPPKSTFLLHPDWV